MLRNEAAAILALVDRVDGRFSGAVDLLRDCRGRVILTGMGKSGIIARKVAATFTSTGTRRFPAPGRSAARGPRPLQREDLVVALSHSGESGDQRAARDRRAHRRPALRPHRVPDSTLGRPADCVLDFGMVEEACPLNLAPTASTTAALAMGDALAMVLLVEKGFREEDFASLHPGGGIGKRLLRVESLMHTGVAVPSVGTTTPMHTVVAEISAKGLGMTCVVAEDGRLAGIITDGDLRRHMAMAGLLAQPASAVMTAGPRTIGRSLLAVEALAMMEQRKITSLVVVDAEARVEGVLHLHDLWRTQMF